MQVKNLIPGAKRAAEKHEAPSPVVALQREINRVFDGFWRAFEHPFSGWFEGRVGLGAPRVDVAETDAGVEVTAELPGMDEKDIEVAVSNDLLTIKGEKKHEREEKKKGYYLAERSYGSFYRAIQLPAGVDGSKATAEFKKGVLTVTAPRTAEAAAKVKKIAVKKA